MRRLAVLALAAALAGCGGAAVPGASHAPPPALERERVEVREVDIDVTAEAVVEAVRQSTVAAQVAGRIVELPFDVGDRVEKGQVIARIDERVASQAQAASEAQVRAARAAYANAHATYQRSRELLARNFISPSALDKAMADDLAAESQLKAMLAGAGQAATERSFATIVAPYSGVVAARLVQLGEMATPGKPLLTGFDPTSLRVVATLPSRQLAELPAGARVRVELPATGKWVEATGYTIVPSADPRTHSTQVRIALPSVVGAVVVPGTFARAHFVVRSEPRLMVPRAAVVRRSEVTAVYVVGDDGTPRLRQVRVGSVADERGVEVLAGLQAGESVAIDPLRATAVARG